MERLTTEQLIQHKAKFELRARNARGYLDHLAEPGWLESYLEKRGPRFVKRLPYLKLANVEPITYFDRLIHQIGPLQKRFKDKILPYLARKIEDIDTKIAAEKAQKKQQTRVWGTLPLAEKSPSPSDLLPTIRQRISRQITEVWLTHTSIEGLREIPINPISIIQPLVPEGCPLSNILGTPDEKAITNRDIADFIAKSIAQTYLEVNPKAPKELSMLEQRIQNAFNKLMQNTRGVDVYMIITDMYRHYGLHYNPDQINNFLRKSNTASDVKKNDNSGAEIKKLSASDEIKMLALDAIVDKSTTQEEIIQLLEGVSLKSVIRSLSGTVYLLSHRLSHPGITPQESDLWRRIKSLTGQQEDSEVASTFRKWLKEWFIRNAPTEEIDSPISDLDKEEEFEQIDTTIPVNQKNSMIERRDPQVREKIKTLLQEIKGAQLPKYATVGQITFPLRLLAHEMREYEEEKRYIMRFSEKGNSHPLFDTTEIAIALYIKTYGNNLDPKQIKDLREMINQEIDKQRQQEERQQPHEF